MTTNPLLIFVPSEEGGGIFHAPVRCKRLTDDSYVILEDEFFDPTEDSQLYKFGPGDVVVGEKRPVEAHDVTDLFAHELIRSGSQVNDLKRLLFVIVEESPEPASLLKLYGKTAVRHLLTKLERKDGWIYPGVFDYVDQHRERLEQAL